MTYHRLDSPHQSTRMASTRGDTSHCVGRSNCDARCLHFPALLQFRGSDRIWSVKGRRQVSGNYEILVRRNRLLLSKHSMNHSISIEFFFFQCVRNPLISRRYVTHPISLPILGWKTMKWMQRPCHKTVVKMYWIIGFHHAKNNRMAGTDNARWCGDTSC